MKDYMASTTAGDMSASSEEQHVEQAIKTFVAEELSGIEITEYWFHPDGDNIYELCYEARSFNWTLSTVSCEG